MFEPRTAEEIRSQMMAQLIAQTDLSDVAEGGVAHSILGVVAIQEALHEQRIAGLYRAFNFQGHGPDLDEQVAQIPQFEPRLGPSAAGGACMRFERVTATEALTVPAGIRVAQTNHPNVTYVTTSEFTLAVGQFSYPGPGQSLVRITCVSPGPAGNTPAGTITTISFTPSPAIVACANMEPVGGGLERESDASLRWRALHYLASLAQTSKPAVEYLARLFRAADGTRIRHVTLAEDFTTPAYAELVVDDGTGFVGSTRPGAEINFVVPPGGQLSFHFESPAATTPQVAIDGVTIPTSQHGWVTLHERGVAQRLPGTAYLRTEGQAVRIYGYDVYYGFIAELQRAIEGLDALPLRGSPGWRVPGARLRVVAPELQYITLTATLVAEAGFDLDDVRRRVKSDIVSYLQELAPGAPLILFQLAARIRRLAGVYDLRWPPQAANIYPHSPRAKLYPLEGGITLTV